MPKSIILSFFILSILFSACSSRKKISYKNIDTHKTQLKKYKPKIKKLPKNVNYKTKALYDEYKKWVGTKYKLGGDSLKGIDCSSFVQQVYYNAFGLKIPRTTKEQSKVGSKISKKELQVGDMIFFKTGWNVRHVGIIIENGKFIHTSTNMELQLQQFKIHIGRIIIGKVEGFYHKLLTLKYNF